MNPPADLNDDLLFVGCAVTGTDEGTVYLYNPTGGSINDTAKHMDIPTNRYVSVVMKAQILKPMNAHRRHACSW
jgi:hypothetical protein